MRTGIVLMVIMGVAVTAMAQDLGNSRELPVKNTPVQTYEPPAVLRQGGDTIGEAFPIGSLPFTDTGTTAGYVHDYEEQCPHESMSPDVVYRFTPEYDVLVDVDLCGSGYDTKTYIYEGEGFHLVACNDDFYFDDLCGMYVSKIEYADLTGGATYYIVIDGYGGESGDYLLEVTETGPCNMYCPDDAVPEGEPPLADDYRDAHNGGCDSPYFGNPFQEIDWINVEGGNPYDGYAWLCGVSGWYRAASGGHRRDTDWYRVFALQTGVMEFTVEAEFPCYMNKMAPLDCATVEAELGAIVSCENPATLSFPVDAGEEIWLMVCPTTFSGPVTEFTYFMTVSNNTYDTVPTEKKSWGGVKALYR